MTAKDKTISVLLAAARDLLIEASRLNGDPNQRWQVARVSQREPKSTLVLPEEWETDTSEDTQAMPIVPLLESAVTEERHD